MAFTSGKNQIVYIIIYVESVVGIQATGQALTKLSRAKIWNKRF